MTFKKKLLLAGLVGTTCVLLYKLSKKREKERERKRIEQAPQAYPNTAAAPPSQGHNYAAWGAAGAGAAALGAAGYAYHQHNQSQQQQQQQPAAPPVQPPELTGDTLWADLKDWKVIARLLAATVADQYLYPFYDWPKIQYMAQQIASSGTLADIADSWEMPPFLAQDLVKLALFDVMFLLDDSASMNSERGARIEGLRQIVKRSADAAGRLDPDGMEVAWMNADLPPQDSKIRSAKDADRLVKQCRFDGRATPLGYALDRKLLRPHLFDPLSRGYLKKPVLAIVITDGRPTGSSEKGEKIVQVIKEAKERLKSSQHGEDALSVTIAAVGNDSEAQDWLDSIDSHPVIGDLVDVVSDIHNEGRQIKQKTGVDLTPDLHCLKLLLGGIDTGYDASDEPPTGKHTRRQADKDQKDAKFAESKRRLVADRDAAMTGASAAPAQSPYGYPQSAQQAGGYSAAGSTYSAPPPQQQQQQHQQQAPTGVYPPPSSSVYPLQTAYGAPQQSSQYGAPPSNPMGPYGAPPPPYTDHARGAPEGAQSGYGGYGGYGGSAPDAGAGSDGYHPGVGGFAMPTPQQHSAPYGAPPQQGGYGAPPQSTYPGQQGGTGFPSAFPS